MSENEDTGRTSMDRSFSADEFFHLRPNSATTGMESHECGDRSEGEQFVVVNGIKFALEVRDSPFELVHGCRLNEK